VKKALLVLLLVPLVAWAQDEVTLHFDSSPHKEEIAATYSLSITIEGTDQATNFVRSLHPLLSLNWLGMKVEGTQQVKGKKNKVEHDDVRVNVRYDDDDYEYDWKKGEPPEDLGKSKLTQMIWAIAMSPRSYDLSKHGVYKSDDPNQDSNGEALDLYMHGITRLKKDAVVEGDSWTSEWKGERSEKGKKAKWAFTQVVKLEKFEEQDGHRLALLTSKLTGVLEGDEDKSADEKWTKCAGTTRVLVDVATGFIHEQSGQGVITAYYRSAAEDGSKNEVTIKTAIEGKRAIRK